MKIKYLSDKIKAVKSLWYRKYFVVLDGRANSVTISQSLHDHMMRVERENIETLMFKSSDTGLYCFCMREDFPQLMQTNGYFCQLQYNEQYHKIGFRSEHPSVTAICDDYGCPLDRAVFLSVLPRKTKHGYTFYEIQRPK